MFADAYKKLNKAQKEAVDTIDGPVMVIAGPGTGKTDVLAVRIAHILKETDTPANAILCLTFTNAGVRAMRERVTKYIGAAAGKVSIYTFHSFAIGLVQQYYELLDFNQVPDLLDEMQEVALIDEILEEGQWLHIRPRGNSSKYFSDLKSLVSLMKREQLAPEFFSTKIDEEIINLMNDPANLSSRGITKGELKKEILKNIEGLERTKEVVAFYKAYEKEKIARNLIDYDDVLICAVKLAEVSEDLRATLRENYLYILVDEHQDSSGVQNAFLERVWGDVEKPNLFVVGDDRQLIYGFGGASIEHFSNFRTVFGTAKEITLTENYRSTQAILDTAGSLLSSTLTDDTLHANSTAPNLPLTLLECDYPRDEILFAARIIQEKMKEGISPADCAILVPKNYQVRNAVQILRDQNIPVAATGAISFFEMPETVALRTILKIIADPFNAVALSASLFESLSEIPPLAAHTFLHEHLSKKLSLKLLSGAGVSNGLFVESDPVAVWGRRLESWLDFSQNESIEHTLQHVAESLFFKNISDQITLMRRVEIVRTFLHLLLSAYERNNKLSITDFLSYLDRLEAYGHLIPLAVFSGDAGVHVLTLHGSKGLEFSFVHIAHLDESSLMKGRRLNFTLPESIESLIEAKDEIVARRELYVAITRAKETCTLSYARHTYTGATLVPASIVSGLSEKLVIRKSIADTEEIIIGDRPEESVIVKKETEPKSLCAQLIAQVSKEYADTRVSVTLLNNFFECPWKWYFRSLLRLPEMKSESLMFGSLVHGGIEFILKQNGQVSQKQITEILQSSLDKEHIYNPTERKRMVREAVAVLAGWQSVYLPNIAKKYDTERPLSYKDPAFPHLSLYGKIDLTERLSNEKASVTDFKTGSSKSRNVIEKRDEEGRLSPDLRQLAMYSYLISGTENNTRVVESKLLYIEENPKDKDAIYRTIIDDEIINLLRRDIVDYDTFAKEGTWINRQCLFKSYGKNTECPYCALADRIYMKK